MILDFATVRSVFAERAEQERLLRWRHQGFDVVYNYLIAILILATGIACTIWGLDIRAERKGAEMVATAHAAWEANQAAAEEQAKAEELARQQEKEAVIKRWAIVGAKALYPMKNFVEMYHYTANDLKTYLRSGTNRADATGKSIEEVFSQPNQYLNYSDDNPVLEEFLDVSTEFFTEYYAEQFEEKAKPVDVSFQFAELLPNGIFLTNVFGADGYARRWQA